MTTALSPAAKERQKLLSRFNAQQKKLVERFYSRERKADQADVMTKYDHGADIVRVMEDPETYGVDMVGDLATITGHDVNDLYNYRNFAVAFPDREVVEKLMAKPTAAGTTLTWSHFRALILIEDKRERQKFLDRCFEKGLTGNQLQTEIDASTAKRTREMSRGGGRKPARPTSMPAGIRQIVSNARTFMNRLPIWRESVFDRLRTAPVEELTEDLVPQVNEAYEEMARLREEIDEQLDRMDEGRQRLVKVISKKKSTKTASNGKPQAASGKSQATSKAKPKLATAEGAPSKMPNKRKMPFPTRKLQGLAAAKSKAKAKK